MTSRIQSWLLCARCAWLDGAWAGSTIALVDARVLSHIGNRATRNTIALRTADSATVPAQGMRGTVRDCGSSTRSNPESADTVLSERLTKTKNRTGRCVLRDDARLSCHWLVSGTIPRRALHPEKSWVRDPTMAECRRRSRSSAAETTSHRGLWRWVRQAAPAQAAEPATP